MKEYEGFKFINTEKVDPKIWAKHKEHEDIFIPNKRTAKGREMNEFLLNGLQYSWYDSVWEIVKADKLTRFTFPFLELANNVILLFLDHKHQPKEDENIIEITPKEFHTILKNSQNE